MPKANAIRKSRVPETWCLRCLAPPPRAPCVASPCLAAGRSEQQATPRHIETLPLCWSAGPCCGEAVVSSTGTQYSRIAISPHVYTLAHLKMWYYKIIHMMQRFMRIKCGNKPQITTNWLLSVTTIKSQHCFKYLNR